MVKQCEVNNCNLILPKDVVVSKDHNSKGKLKSLEKLKALEKSLYVWKEGTRREGQVESIIITDMHF